MLDPFRPARPEGELQQYVKTLGSYALSCDASEMALGVALSQMRSLVFSEHEWGAGFLAVVVKLRVFGLPASSACYGVAQGSSSDFLPPFHDHFAAHPLFHCKDEGRRRSCEAERRAWAFKQMAIVAHKREMLGRIQLMGDTWAKVRMTLGKLDPLPGRVPAKGKRKREEGASDSE